MTKYATLKKYQPYIDAVMRDLKLEGKVVINWVFGSWKTFGGDAELYDTVFSNGMRYGQVRVDKTATHEYILMTIMHELKHIQQYVLGKLTRSYIVQHRTRTGRIVGKWKAKWMGKEYDFFGTSKNPKLDARYKAQPWEVEAYAYQSLSTKLFPNGKVLAQPKRKLVGVVGTVKFFKIAS